MDNPTSYEVKLTNAQGVSIGLGKKPPAKSITKPDDDIVYCAVEYLHTLMSGDYRPLVDSVIPVGKGIVRVNKTRKGRQSVSHPPQR